MDTNQETNRERLPQKQAAQGKIGSEPDAKRQVADGTNEPEKIKKPRKTKAEQLIDLLKKQEDLAVKIADLKASMAGATSKDALRLLEMIGDACFKALAGNEQLDLCKFFEQLLLEQMGKKDRAWYGIHSKALLAQGLPIIPPKADDSGNNAGAPKNNGKATAGDTPAKP